MGSEQGSEISEAATGMAAVTAPEMAPSSSFRQWFEIPEMLHEMCSFIVEPLDWRTDREASAFWAHSQEFASLRAILSDKTAFTGGFPCKPSKASLISLSLVCRSFNDHALDFLWEDQPLGFVPLLSVLPGFQITRAEAASMNSRHLLPGGSHLKSPEIFVRLQPIDSEVKSTDVCF